jgi:glutamate formiminotransferase
VLIDEVASAAGSDLLDVHSDPHHHRSVLTVMGEDAARAVTVAAIERIDLADHQGVHPRIGSVDVVPFVPLDGLTMDDAVAARNRFCTWAGATLDLPSAARSHRVLIDAFRSGDVARIEQASREHADQFCTEDPT